MILRITKVMPRPISGSAIPSSEGDHGGAGHHGQADVGIGSSVVAIGDQGRAVEVPSGTGSDLGRKPVSDIADQSGPSRGRRVGRRLRVDQPRDGLDSGDAGRDEDRCDHEQPGVSLRSLGSEQEGNAERNRGGGIAEVVDQIGEQGDAAAGDEDGRLSQRGRSEDGQREPDRSQPFPRALDAAIHESVGVAVRPGSPTVVACRRCSWVCGPAWGWACVLGPCRCSSPPRGS